MNAKSHWSSAVFILCWSDPKSGGRRRMSWGTREHLERLAETMTDEHDPRLYSGFGKKLTIRAAMPDVASPEEAPRPKSGRPRGPILATASK